MLRLQDHLFLIKMHFDSPTKHQKQIDYASAINKVTFKKKVHWI